MLIKKQKLRNKLIFSSKEVGTVCCKKNCSIVQSLLFIGAGAGAGQKRTGSSTLMISMIKFHNENIIFKWPRRHNIEVL